MKLPLPSKSVLLAAAIVLPTGVFAAYSQSTQNVPQDAMSDIIVTQTPTETPLQVEESPTPTPEPSQTPVEPTATPKPQVTETPIQTPMPTQTPEPTPVPTPSPVTCVEELQGFETLLPVKTGDTIGIPNGQTVLQYQDTDKKPLDSHTLLTDSFPSTTHNFMTRTKTVAKDTKGSGYYVPSDDLDLVFDFPNTTTEVTAPFDGSLCRSGASIAVVASNGDTALFSNFRYQK